MNELLDLSCEAVKDIKLSREEVKRYLLLAEGWHQTDARYIQKTFEFGSFAESIRFVNLVAEEAESEEHHPDIDIRFDKVTLSLSTHGAGELTLCDFILAAKINELNKTQWA